MSTVTEPWVEKNRILLIGAHCDDVEMNAGGSMHKWGKKGKEVAVAVFAATEGGQRFEECRAACRKLNVDRVFALHGRDTRLTDDFMPLLDRLEGVMAEFQPDTVVAHFHADTHQDHVAAYKITVAAARKVPNFLMFKPTYPSGRSDIPFHPTVISILSDEDMEAKTQAINCFISQRNKYGDENWAQAMRAVSQGDAWTYSGHHGHAELFQLGRLTI